MKKNLERAASIREYWKLLLELRKLGYRVRTAKRITPAMVAEREALR